MKLDDLKALAKEFRASKPAAVEGGVLNLSEATLDELEQHHNALSDHLASSKLSPHLHRKIEQLHGRIGQTIENVKDEISKHEEQADFHEEQESNVHDSMADAPHDFGGGGRYRRRGGGHNHEENPHVGDIGEYESNLSSAHSDAARWHRDVADELRQNDVPDHLVAEHDGHSNDELVDAAQKHFNTKHGTNIAKGAFHAHLLGGDHPEHKALMAHLGDKYDGSNPKHMEHHFGLGPDEVKQLADAS